MTKPRRYGVHSLRFKLVLASVAVEALMLTVLVWNSTRITGDALAELFQNRIETLVPMMNASLVDPLAQRDYATLDERLGRIVHRESLVYVEVRDELGQLVAGRGAVPEPARLDTSFQGSDHVYDQEFDITLAGRTIGRALRAQRQPAGGDAGQSAQSKRSRGVGRDRADSVVACHCRRVVDAPPASAGAGRRPARGRRLRRARAGCRSGRSRRCRACLQHHGGGAGAGYRRPPAR